MHYGRVGFVRTTRHSNTDWRIQTEPVDYHNDRVSQEEYKPNNSLFFYYPETMTDEEAIELLLDKKVEEMAEEAEWAAKTYVLQSKAFQKYKNSKIESFDDIESELKELGFGDMT